jgi:hypothetical protein
MQALLLCFVYNFTPCLSVVPTSRIWCCLRVCRLKKPDIFTSNREPEIKYAIINFNLTSLFLKQVPSKCPGTQESSGETPRTALARLEPCPLGTNATSGLRSGKVWDPFNAQVSMHADGQTNAKRCLMWDGYMPMVQRFCHLPCQLYYILGSW